ncbi:glycoside hydrolase family 15 protein [Limibaculum sp. FT325]|uniref:glycoside hydrolase family 15 protein n=1 Tax=Thermohalobaculum sediminis TaxID=2939436 RepID=UPI0020C01693|nr:glycoside hydrolase family 15 protein [Limibaculum sediminis]MCL5778676.1 glycoside hydrolase family 15 protein [Limibaculum sediminis]
MTAAAEDGLDRWLEAQARASREAMRLSVSPENFRHERAEFGQQIVAAPGSVVASRHRARWDPMPDYAWHWVRDAAVVMRLAPMLAVREPSSWQERMRDHAAFSLRIATQPGPAANPLRATTLPRFRRFLRPDAELAALAGPVLLGEPRANLDGSVDAERWSRPQHDGPALRALSFMAMGAARGVAGDRLLALDLAYTVAQAAAPCVGPWEEEGENGLHAFTLMAQRAALRAACDSGVLTEAATQAPLARIEAALGGLADPASGVIRASSIAAPGASDAAVILGALIAGDWGDAFGPADPRLLATAAWLVEWSARRFPVWSAAFPVIGRGPADRFFGGNPWIPTTLGMAEFHFALAGSVLTGQALPADASRSLGAFLGDDAAARSGDRGAAAARIVIEGERYLAAVRHHAPPDGRLPEQIDGTTGAPASCPDLTWSHAALISAVESRRTVRARLAGG